MRAGVRECGVFEGGFDEGVGEAARGAVGAEVVGDDVVGEVFLSDDAAAVGVDAVDEGGALGEALEEEEGEACEEVAGGWGGWVGLCYDDLGAGHGGVVGWWWSGGCE